MGEKNGRRFNLKTLLKAGDLDMRKISRNNLSMLVGEYYRILERFVNRVPMVLEAANKIIALKAADYDFRTLGDIKYLLDGMGYEKFSPVIDQIIHAGKMGHTKFASDCAKGILDEFNGLYTRIMAAEETKEDETAAEIQPANDQSYTYYLATPLKVVLQLLDHEESARKMKILAIDDSPVVIKIISTLLNKDYDVYGLTNPTMLGKFLQRITPELFLLDYKMPELSGFDLVPIIRGFKEHKETPIIFLTSMGTMDYVSAALALGACDYIVKPCQENNLREKVAKHIVRKKLY